MQVTLVESSELQNAGARITDALQQQQAPAPPSLPRPPACPPAPQPPASARAHDERSALPGGAPRLRTR